MTEFFPDYELECICGCGLMNMNKDFMIALEIARKLADVPFTINSACRCETHNKKVGGKSTSSHLTGYAVDIATSSSKGRFKILQALVNSGFTRIGVANNFIHVDDDPSKPHDVVWVY